MSAAPQVRHRSAGGGHTLVMPFNRTALPRQYHTLRPVVSTF